MNLNVKTVSDLRKMARDKGISYTGMSKAQLVHYLTSEECAPPKKSCSGERICDLFSNRCVENKYLKSGLMVETIDDLRYAGLKKDFAKWYQVLDKIKSDEKIAEVVIEPLPIEKIRERIETMSNFISRDDILTSEIDEKINVFERYNAAIYSIVN